MKKLLLVPLLLLSLVLAWCSDADIASQRLSKDADMFRIDRRIVFYNGITDTYMLTIEWRCSLWNNDISWQLTVTCRTWEDEYKKHFLWLSDNVTYFVEQLQPRETDVNHYKVIFNPSVIIPDIEIR